MKKKTIKQTKALLDNLRGDSDPFQAAMASSPNQAEDKRISFSGSRSLNSMETSVLLVQIHWKDFCFLYLYARNVFLTFFFFFSIKQEAIYYTQSFAEDLKIFHQQILLIFKFIFYYYFYPCACMYALTNIYVCNVCTEAHEAHWILWTWGYRWLWANMWELRTKHWSSATTTANSTWFKAFLMSYHELTSYGSLPPILPKQIRKKVFS